ncbi:MAG TPA: hypothetical protein VI078_10355 [bacterium]
MRTTWIKGIMALAAVMGAVAFVAEAQAQVNAISGKSKLTITKREVVPAGDVEGHILMLGESNGTNANTGKWVIMDGAKARGVAIYDLTKGNGSQNGYFILSKDGNENVVKITGAIKTVLSPEGKPLTTLSGDWRFVKCTGLYEGCTGQGTYQGAFTAENEYLVEFKGILVQ